MKLIHAKTGTHSGQPFSSSDTIEGERAKREPTDDSAFWPELDSDSAAQLIERGYGEQVEFAKKTLPLIRTALKQGWPIPPTLKERQVFELSKMMIYGKDPKTKLRAMELLHRMQSSNDRPNALPDQLSPTGPSQTNVQVNVNLEQPERGPHVRAAAASTTVSELIDEFLQRQEVQQALDDRVPLPEEDYGV